MLKNNFFYINEIKNNTTEIVASISIVPNHEILKGHFPGEPIVPGVCMLQMLKEILEEALQLKIVLHSASFMKFMNMFAVTQFQNAIFTIVNQKENEHLLTVNATLYHNEELVFMKSKMKFNIL